MPLRPPAGFISANYDPLKNPDAPTGVTAAAGDAQATVSFTAPSNVGGSAISAYYAVSNPSQITASGASSPITVTGLTNDTAYTFQVWALNTFGPGAFSAASGSVTPAAPRGLFGGGEVSGNSNVISYITISSVGNAADFGDLTASRPELSACSSSTRGVFGGGNTAGASSSGWTNIIDYVTIASIGNATDFGDLTVSRQGLAASSNSTRGIFFGGNTADGEGTPIWKNVIDYITIASAGNATDFGDLTTERGRSGACASSTRALVAGGEPLTVSIFYVTISSTGNASSFGSLTGTNKYFLTGCSSDTRGVFAGGSLQSGSTNIIDYVTISSTGNATDFGDLTISRGGLAGCSSLIRGVFAGGTTAGIKQNVIDYISISSTGNATDFGDLLNNTVYLAACSNAHGGLA